MTKDCKDKITWLMTQGTKLDNLISAKLLEKDYFFTTIQSFGEQLDIAISTASRYVKKLGYHSFKHFICEYNDKFCDNVQNVDVNLNALTTKSTGKTIDDYQLESNISLMGRKLKGKIFVISSQRCMQIAKLITSRLKEAAIEAKYFREELGDIRQWIKQINVGDSVIMITVSGHSLRVQKSIDLFDRWKEKPFLLIITYTKALKNRSNISVLTPNSLNTKYHLNDWIEFNVVQLKILNIVILLLNSMFLFRTQKQ